ncbi:MAG: Gp49 family protein [Janthinobacterium lividum]
MIGDEVEAEIQAKKLTAARVTPAMIDATIVGEDYFRATGTLTICVLTLRNGFTVTGESACASPENFNQQLGEKIARAAARDKIWALEGYALRERLAAK